MSETEAGGKWTPGPWVYPARPGDDWGEVRTQKGRRICKCDALQSYEKLNEYRANKIDPTSANASLIAASPAMAEALGKAIPVLLSAHENDASFISWSALESARAALKLAQGE